MFIQNCFIHKNTKELRNKLKNIGCNPNPLCVDKGYSCLVIEGKYFYDLEERFMSDYYKRNAIDCGENEDLFLAIAALRDDSDYMQWFVDDETKYDEYNGMELTHKGDWNLCTESRYEDYDGHKELKHKATIEELIEHFKDE